MYMYMSNLCLGATNENGITQISAKDVKINYTADREFGSDDEEEDQWCWQV
jgi:hypothetical protein